MAETGTATRPSPRRRRGTAVLLRDIGFVSFGKYGQYLITVVTLPIIARVLGAEGLGLLAIGMSAYFIGSLVVDLGITSFLAARVHERHTDTQRIGQLRGDYLAIRLTILGGLGALLTLGMMAAAPARLHMVLLGLFAGGVWSISEDWLLIGQGRFGASAVYQGAGRIVYLLLLVLLLPRWPSASVALLCLLSSAVVTVAATWVDAWRRFGPPARPRAVRAILRLGAPVFASRLLVTGYGQGAPVVYAAVLDAASLGLYSAGDRLVRAIQSLLDTVGFAFLPRMARRSAHDRFWRNAIQVLTMCAGIAGLAAAGVWLLAPTLIRLIFGSGFEGTIPLLRVEVLILPAMTVTSFITTALLPVRQDTVGVLIGALIGTCVAASALAIAFRNNSVWALVYGTVLTEIAVALWYLFRVRQLIVRERAAAVPAGQEPVR
ncbi:lipopolysaccharide biosynthesis protein [Nocardia brasiliensis]|uniref:MOP superfamily O-antigen transporter n=1 Tax=Nocardia brasiliensis (strain ATCC 700358 / HUJEG-1) TaxID=1133849 RepID=K0EMV9_NOCB7|nr:lipopolysaccharide biosynthesis protein [Nocardia brasiliensis]AFU00958.1 MOP superfamily O-antigen transporter [Nocardia brasiliensis ATCC 700358]OCF84180.1 transporter [Nocardia brasiliensis]